MSSHVLFKHIAKVLFISTQILFVFMENLQKAICSCHQVLFLYSPQPYEHYYQSHKLSFVVRKPAFCICENKDADQLRGNLEADQRLYFRHTDSAIPHLSKSEISSI